MKQIIFIALFLLISCEENQPIENLFRFDASEIMARGKGSNKLWILFKEYIKEGPQNLVKLLNSFDKNI